MRNKFTEQLNSLNNQMIYMGSLCENAIDLIIDSLNINNLDLAQKAIDKSSEIESLEKDIESLCMKLLLEQQPVASDLRQISSALKIASDLKRIGNHIEDIGLIVLHVKKIDKNVYPSINEMAYATKRMLNEAIDAFVKKNVELAINVIDEDDVVDQCFIDIKTVLIELISKHKENGELALDLFMISKYFERIGDHAANVAEWVIYSVTGVHKGES